MSREDLRHKVSELVNAVDLRTVGRSQEKKKEGGTWYVVVTDT